MPDGSLPDLFADAPPATAAGGLASAPAAASGQFQIGDMVQMPGTDAAGNDVTEVGQIVGRKGNVYTFKRSNGALDYAPAEFLSPFGGTAITVGGGKSASEKQEAAPPAPASTDVAATAPLPDLFADAPDAKQAAAAPPAAPAPAAGAPPHPWDFTQEAVSQIPFANNINAGLIAGAGYLGNQVGQIFGAEPGPNLGERYDTELAGERAAQQAYQQEHPIASAAADVLGTGGALATMAPAAVEGALTRATSFIPQRVVGLPLRTMAQGALGNAAVNGAQAFANSPGANMPGATLGDDLQARLDAARQAATVGAELGAAVPGVAGLAGNVLRGVGRLAAGLPVVGDYLTAVHQAAAARNLGVTPQTLPEYERALSEGEANLPPVPGVHYGVGDITNNPDLLAQQRRFDLSSPPSGEAPNGAPLNANARRMANNAAIAQGLEAGSPAGAAEAVAPAIQGRVDPAMAYMQGRADAAAERGAEAIQAAQQMAQTNATLAQQQAVERLTAAQQAAAEASRAAEEEAASRAGNAQQTAEQMAAAEQQRLESELAQKRQSVTEPLNAPRRTGEQAGEVARSEIEQEHGARKAVASKLYRGVDPDGVTLADTTPLQEAVATVKGEMGSPLADRSQTPDFIADGRSEKVPDVINYNELKTLRTSLGNAAAKARQAGDFEKERHTLRILDGVNAIIDDIANGGPKTPYSGIKKVIAADANALPAEVAQEAVGSLSEASGETARAEGTGTYGGQGSNSGRTGELGGGPRKGRAETRQSDGHAAGETTQAAGAGSPETRYDPAVAERYRAANAYFKSQVAEPFRRGTVAKVLRETATGPAVPPSKTLDKFVQSKEAARDFIRAVGGRPQAVAAMHDYIIDKLAEAVNVDGRLTAQKIANVRDRLEPVLNAKDDAGKYVWPEARKIFDSVAQMQREVDDLAAAYPERLGVVKGQARNLVASEKAAGQQAVAERRAAGKAAVQQAQEEGRQAVAKAAEEGKQTVAQAKEKAAEGKALAQTRLKRTKDFVQQKAIKNMMGAEDASEVINRVGSIVRAADGQAQARTLARVLRKDPDAQAGLAKATWDWMRQQIESPIEGEGIALAKGAKILRDNAETLKILLGGEDPYNRAMEILKAREVATRADRAIGLRANSSTIENAHRAGLPSGGHGGGGVLTTLAILAGEHGAEFAVEHFATHPVLAGALSAIGIGVGLATRAITAASRARLAGFVDHLSREAINDPAVFRLLMTRVTKDNERAIAARLFAFAGAYGATRYQEPRP